MAEPSAPLPGARQDTPGTGNQPSTATRARRASTVVALAALAAGIVSGALVYSVIDALGDEDSPFAGRIDVDGYQAVVLSNDRVYFGRLRDVSDTFFELDQAYFLREPRVAGSGEPAPTLLPISSEVHAPENRMLIRKDEVVLVENLAEDSPVSNEIARQGDGGAVPTSDSSRTTATTTSR